MDAPAVCAINSCATLSQRQTRIFFVSLPIQQPSFVALCALAALPSSHRNCGTGE